MNYSAKANNRAMAEDEKAFFDKLKKTFDQLDETIDIYLFYDRGKDDIFCQTARQVIKVFRQISEKITFREFPTDNELAKKWKIEHSPTLLISPEKYAIRWLGAPMGEEGRIFLETLILVGTGNSNLSNQSRNVMKKITDHRDIKVFVSPTCPYCPQEAVNAIKAAIEKPDLISLEIIDVQCNPGLANQYSAHSVPQAYANDILIGQGAQQEEVFISSLEKLEPQTIFIPESDAELVETDVLIIGGGPAGLAAGIYAERSGLKTAVIEKGALGGQVATTPVVENYPGFPQIGGKTLVDIMVSHALEYVSIFQGEEVIRVQTGEHFEITTTRRRFLSRSVLLATGASHNLLNVPGESRLSGRGVSYCSTCDGPLFKGKKVLMVGGGNSALTEALHLRHIGVDVTIVHRRDKFRAQDFLIHQIKASGIPVLWNTQIKEILGEERVSAVLLQNTLTNETSRTSVDGVFIAIGYAPAVKLAKDMGIELTEEGYIAHDEKHRTNIPGVYSAGDVEGGYKQIVTATGQGSSAAMAIFEDLINPYWKHNVAKS